MGWADTYVKKLQKGETVSFRPRGNSMSGIIDDGQLVTVVPVAADAIRMGDAVLVRVSGRIYLHLVKAIQGERVQIGNNRGYINGWTTKSRVYGRVSQVDP